MDLIAVKYHYDNERDWRDVRPLMPGDLRPEHHGRNVKEVLTAFIAEREAQRQALFALQGW